MVKIVDGLPLYIDTNFLFSWKGITESNVSITEDFENLKQLSEKYNANNQIKFVLKYIFELYGQDFLFESSNFFDFINTNVNYYY
jgi:hypothetical protein